CCMPATDRRTSSAWKTLRGNTTSNNLRTCETVSAGAFFFQPHLEMPEKEVGQHTRQHMIEFIPIKSWVTKGSGAPGSYARHSRVPSRDRGYPASTSGCGL